MRDESKWANGPIIYKDRERKRRFVERSHVAFGLLLVLGYAHFWENFVAWNMPMFGEANPILAALSPVVRMAILVPLWTATILAAWVLTVRSQSLLYFAVLGTAQVVLTIWDVAIVLVVLHL